jgi:hypothetical protein
MTTVCGSLSEAAVGTLNGSATFDACDADTIVISADGLPSSTADKQYVVQREVCGDGEVLVKVLSVTGGRAGLELRADNAPGSVKVGLRTALGTFVYRFSRTQTDSIETSYQYSAPSHKWLRIARSGNSVVTYVSVNGSSWTQVAAYTISLPTCVQAGVLMQSLNNNTTHTGTFSDLQYSGFTEPEGPATTLYFDQDSLVAQAGDTVNICVNIADPCACAPTTVDVALEGSGSPHLPGFTTQTLVFQDTASQKCFSLAIADEPGVGNYTLVLQNAAGGNGAEAGTPQELALRVEGEPLPKSFCGVFPLRELPHPDSAIVAYDRFGNAYLASDLMPGTQVECLGTAGYFALTYEGNPFTAAEQETICEVFNYLSGIISNPSGLPVQIKIKKVVLAEEILAAGSSMYRHRCGISFPMPLEIMNGLPSPYNDEVAGEIEINSLVTQWHTLDNDPLSSGSDLYDLYSVVLHEAIHALGFGTRIGAAGPAIENRYSNYDLFLQTADGTPLIVAGEETPECCQPYNFNYEVAPLGQVSAFLNSLIDNCGATGGGSPPKIVFNEEDAFPTVNGSNLGDYLQALSHLDEVCDDLSGQEYYVMYHKILPGVTRRNLHATELDILRYLGYIVDEENDTGYDCVINALYDHYNAFNLVPGGSVIVPFALLLLNDLAPPFEEILVSYDEEGTENSEYITVSTIDTDNDEIDDAFLITALPISELDETIIFRYRITGCGGLCHKTTFILTILNVDEVPGCPETGYCDNLVCNGDFENFRSILSLYWGQAGLPPVVSAGEEINFLLWDYNNSPDIAFEGPNSSVNINQFVEFHSEEFLYLPLERPVAPGCTLRLSFLRAGSPILSIFGSEHPPCMIFYDPGQCADNYDDLCIITSTPGIGYEPHCIAGPVGTFSPITGPPVELSDHQFFYNSSFITWQSNEVLWVNNTGVPINWLNIRPAGSRVLIDDIVVTQTCPVDVEILEVTESFCSNKPSEFCFEVCVNNLIEPVELTVDVALPEGFVILSDNIPAALEFLEDGCQEVCLTILNTTGIIPEEDPMLTVQVSQCGFPEEEEDLSLSMYPCFDCADCNTGNTIGETGQSVLLSDLLQVEDLPANGVGIEACVEGRLKIDQDYNIIGSTLVMQQGSSIEVLEGVTLSVAGSQLFGCDKMWRGIEVQKGGKLKMIDSRTAHAQYALYVHPSENSHEPVSELTLFNNCFDNNFVGFLTPPLSATGKINASVIFNLFINTTELPPPFLGQSSGPEALPDQNERSLAGIIVHNLAGFSSFRNTFEGLAAGIVGYRSNLVIDSDKYKNMMTYEAYYPDFEPRGRALSSRSGGDNALAVSGSFFSDCPQGINAGLTRLKAVGNRFADVPVGIVSTLANAGGIAIVNNRMEGADIGIFAAHTNPAGQVSITGNEISTDAEEAGAGILLLFNHAPAAVMDNSVKVNGAGIGIGLAAGSRTELTDDNKVGLNNTSLVRAGISLEYHQKSLLRGNVVIGSGLTGAGNAGLEIISSPGNIYCCNTVADTRLGAYVAGGSLSSDNFRGTMFGSHNASLYLPNSSAVLGTQTHTQNTWTENSGAAAYGVPIQVALQYPFIIDITPPNGDPAYEPPSHSPEGWFTPAEYIEEPSSVCSIEYCAIDGFAPESPDTKRIAGGDTTLGAATLWELQRYIYEKLWGVAVQDSVIQAFMEQSDSNTIGAFQAVKDDIDAMFAADSVETAQWLENLSLVEEKLDSLVLLDLLIAAADENEKTTLMESRGEVADTLFLLAEAGRALAEDIAENIADAALGIRTKYAGMTVVADFEANEKAVNDIYLSYLARFSADPDSTELVGLQAIAEQCPLLGGNAVYRARALLAAMITELTIYNDSLACLSVQALAMPPVQHSPAVAVQQLHAFPNPASDELRVEWNLPVEQSGSLQLFDLFGRQIRRVQLSAGDAGHTMSLGNLPDGIYVLRARLDGRDFVKKIVIQH